MHLNVQLNVQLEIKIMKLVVGSCVTVVIIIVNSTYNKLLFHAAYQCKVCINLSLEAIRNVSWLNEVYV